MMRHLKPKSSTIITFLLALALLAGLCVPATGGTHPASLISGFSAGAGEATITLHAAEYEVSEAPAGQKLDMNGFGYIGVPGAPRLPMKRFLVVLPPGARALSVEVLGLRTSTLSGDYTIAPHDPVMPLPDAPRFEEHAARMRAEWQAEYDAVYGEDRAFPSRAAWLAGYMPKKSPTATENPTAIETEERVTTELINPVKSTSLASPVPRRIPTTPPTRLKTTDSIRN